MPVFTDFQDSPEIKNSAGFLLIAFILFDLSVNVILIIREKIRDAVKSIKKLKAWIKAKLKSRKEIQSKPNEGTKAIKSQKSTVGNRKKPSTI